MNIWHLSESDLLGGAARAAYRIHRALRAAGVDSRMQVMRARSGDPTVRGATTKLEKLVHLGRSELEAAMIRLMRTANAVQHSAAILPSRWPARIARSDANLVHLHWMGSVMLAVADIARIRRPIVWTLHDMWAFCGAEHLAWDNRWREGYRRDNRPLHESGFDLNRWTWQRKRKHWQRQMHIVTPSNWLAGCVRASALMRDWPVSVVANPLDTERWQPVKQELARELLGLPADVPLLAFGSYGANAAHHKGFDLLLGAIKQLRDDPRALGLELVIFGQHAPQSPPSLGFPIHYTGHLHDDLSLRALYSAADAMVIPSRQDNLPNTGVEAHACGTPVVAFDIGGLPDIVEHQRTGYLARAFEVDDLANGILWVLANTERATLRQQARQRAVERFAYPVVAEQYRRLYEQVLAPVST